MVHYRDYDGSPATEAGVPASLADRLRAALEALAARDQVLADRTRRLTALEDVEARLTATAARLESAEHELASLRRAHRADAVDRESRLVELEQRLGPPGPAQPTDAAAAPDTPTPPGEPPDHLPGLITRLQSDLDLERRRNFRLAQVSRAAVAAELARLQEALDSARQRAAALEEHLAELDVADADPSEEGPYARWEGWFRRKLAEREQADLIHSQETISHQRRVLEEKERLIAVLLQRLREVGQVQEGPDDLKQIVGIGPAIEDLLHGLGITSFERLAALTEEEVDRVGDLLGAFRERIRRDRWTEQAAELARNRVGLGPGVSLT